MHTAKSFLLKPAEVLLRQHHFKHASPKTCLRCHYWKHRDSWRAQGCDWLISSEDSGSIHQKWGLGCRVCQQAGSKSLWGRILKKVWNPKHVRQHATEQGHLIALQSFDPTMPIATAQKKKNLDMFAPCADFFMGVIRKCRKGTLARDGKEAVGVLSDRKLTQAVKCLDEALKRSDQDFLLSARCISLMQDESSGFLFIRFSATNCKLQKALFGIWCKMGAKQK